MPEDPAQKRPPAYATGGERAQEQEDYDARPVSVALLLRFDREKLVVRPAGREADVPWQVARFESAIREYCGRQEVALARLREAAGGGTLLFTAEGRAELQISIVRDVPKCLDDMFEYLGVALSLAKSQGGSWADQWERETKDRAIRASWSPQYGPYLLCSLAEAPPGALTAAAEVGHDAAMSPEPSQARTQTVPPELDFDETRLPVTGPEWVAAALVELSSLEVNDPSRAAEQLEKVKRLSAGVERASKDATTAALTRVVAGVARAQGDAKGRVVLEVVQLCAVKGIDTDEVNLTQDEVVAAVQAELNSLRGKELGSYEENSEAIGRLRVALDSCNLRLLYKGQFVHLRPHPMKNSSIQLRAAGRDQSVLLTTTSWPDITVTKSS